MENNTTPYSLEAITHSYNPKKSDQQSFSHSDKNYTSQTANVAVPQGDLKPSFPASKEGMSIIAGYHVADKYYVKIGTQTYKPFSLRETVSFEGVVMNSFLGGRDGIRWLNINTLSGEHSIIKTTEEVIDIVRKTLKQFIVDASRLEEAELRLQDQEYTSAVGDLSKLNIPHVLYHVPTESFFHANFDNCFYVVGSIKLLDTEEKRQEFLADESSEFLRFFNYDKLTLDTEEDVIRKIGRASRSVMIQALRELNIELDENALEPYLNVEFWDSPQIYLRSQSIKKEID